MQKYNYLKIFLLILSFFLIACHKEKEIKSIVFLQGHGEHYEEEISYILDTLSFHFNIDMGNITGKSNELDNYEFVIISDPQKAFNEKEKYILDQYLMKGGSIIALLKGHRIDYQTLISNKKTIAAPLDLNLNDLFFTYNLRINPDLIRKNKTNNVSTWVYNLEINNPWNKTFINMNLSSSIDIVGKNEQIKKNILLQTNESSSRIELPTWIFMKEKDNSIHTTIPFSIGVHNKGIFTSHYKHRLVPDGVIQIGEKLIESKNAQVVLFSSGDLLLNTSPKENHHFFIQLLQNMMKEEK